jgi:hypothetical protein
VHGCCTDANDVYLLRRNFGEAINQVVLKKQPRQSGHPEWEIVVWDWHERTPKHNYLLEPKKLLDDANEAYEAAAGDDTHEGEGIKLAKAINQYKYKHIHLIAHSAGSKLINEAAQTLSELKNQKNPERPFIHLTFLDAYTPNDEDIKGDNSYGSLPDYPNHYAEHYVDKGLAFTNAILQNAFNFDITNWKHTQEEDGFLGHDWPREWYINSITAPEFRYGYGFPLSLESGGGIDRFNEVADKWPASNSPKLCILESETKERPPSCDFE